MSCIITFVDDWADTTRKRIEPTLSKLAEFAPTWCKEIEVQYTPGLEALAQISANECYRRAFLQIGSGLYTREDRIDALLCHEFAHLFTLPMKKVAQRFSEHAFSDGPTPGTRIYDEWVNDSCEGATEDLSDVFLKLIGLGGDKAKR